MNGLVPFVSPENSPQPFPAEEPPDAAAGRLELEIARGPADGPLAELLTRLAAVRLGQGRHGEAERLARRLVALDPNDPQARGLIGVALAESGSTREAVRYLGFAPDLPPFHIAKALALTALGRFDEAEASARRASLLAPDDPEPFRALGSALAAQRRYADALLAFGQALALDPDHPEAHLGRARVRLVLGDDSAWHETEWRTRTAAYAPAVPTTPPAWDGTAAAGLRLLLVAEPADEDTLFFARYVPRLRELGVYVTVSCPPTLAKLLAGVDGVDRVATGEEPPGDVDAYAFLGSLPSLLATADGAGCADGLRLSPKGPSGDRANVLALPLAKGELEGVGSALDRHERGRTHPPQSPLGKGGGLEEAAPERRRRKPGLPESVAPPEGACPPVPALVGDVESMEALDRLPGLKVAVHWRARPDDRRSFPVTALSPLAGVEGVSLASVQEGGAEEAAEANLSLLDLGPAVAEGPTDYETLAAVLRGVDLVVTNDGPVAHLAGVLGVRAWVALPVGPEWPWAGDREDSPWYPSLRLFRQRRADDWSDVFRLMETELKVELAARHAARIGAVPTPGLEDDRGGTPLDGEPTL